MAYPKQSPTVHAETLNDEVCLYDWERKKVHALNPTAARVWQLCDGKTSPEEMAEQLSTRLGAALDARQAEALVWKGLKQLQQAHLLEGEWMPPTEKPTLTRRQMITAGIALALLPVIRSIVAPSPVEAATGPTPTPTATSTVTPTLTPTPTPTATSTPNPPILLYAANNGAQLNGNLGGRAGVDTLCQNSPNKPAGYTRFRGFISVSATDQISDMPSNYGVPTTLRVVGPNGTTIANNWADLLDGTIATNLQTAGISNINPYWWSGSNSNGTLAAINCSGWTSTATPFGEIGHFTDLDFQWMAVGAGPCSLPATVLCMAF